MKEHPIIFSGPMVRAILEGRKTMTRRVVKPSVKCCTVGAYTTDSGSAKPVNVQEDGDPWTDISCPYGQPGDRLWVRETWTECDGVFYAATDTRPGMNGIPQAWRPSIFIPRWASRITLEVTDVRVERVQDISDEDAVREGTFVNQNAIGVQLTNRDETIPRAVFADLWDSINAKRGYSWEANPWVWIIEFKYEK